MHEKNGMSTSCGNIYYSPLVAIQVKMTDKEELQIGLHSKESYQPYTSSPHIFWKMLIFQVEMTDNMKG